MLIKHVRDDNHNPIATFVALDKNLIGLSICCNKDQFNKKRGIEIAAGRAVVGVVGPEHIPNRRVLFYGKKTKLVDVLEKVFDLVKDRANRYFKNKD
jgi:hypothetical protein